MKRPPHLKSIDHWMSNTIAWVEVGALLIIALSTFISFAQEIAHMIERQHVSLADLLLMFIYLEILAMVGIYLKQGKLPIRMPIYIAIVAMARYLIIDIKNMSDMHILVVTIGIVILSLAVLVLRFGSTRYPYKIDTIRKNNHDDTTS